MLIPYLIETWNLSGTPWQPVLTVAGVLLCMIVPYLLGSINFGLIISKNQFHDDVRMHGSGNAGTTNMLRTYGKRAATLTLLGDMAKGIVAVVFGYLIIGASYTVSHEGERLLFFDQYGAAIAGLFVMLGHMFPIFFKFKGGKGVATSMMVMLFIEPITFHICILIYFVLVLSTKYVSLASCMTLIFYPIFLSSICTALGNVFNASINPTAQAISVLMAVLVVFMHRENIKRLIAGTESKTYLFKKKKPAEDPSEGESEEK